MDQIQCALTHRSTIIDENNNSKDGMFPNPIKINVVIDAIRPTSILQMQSFIGLNIFYNLFIPNFSKTFHPLYVLLKKGVTVKWGTSPREVF